MLCYSRNSNCLNNTGSYIDSWADDSSTSLAQSLTLDEQCRLANKDGFTYAVSYILS